MRSEADRARAAPLDRGHDRLLLLAEEPDLDVLVLVEPANELAQIPLLDGDVGVGGSLVLERSSRSRSTDADGPSGWASSERSRRR
jgi:hypothetical protein